MLIAFDLDGTVVDSLRDLAESANELLAGYGAAPLEQAEVGRMVGEGAGVLVARVLAARGLDVPHADALSAYLAIYDRRLLDYTRPYEGIPETLAELAGTARLAMLTNKPARAAHRILDALDLGRWFEWVIGGDSGHGRKPAPDALRWIMGAAGAAPRGTMLVGDSAIDVLTARAALARPCIARYGFGFASMPRRLLTGTELAVDAPGELPVRVREWVLETASVPQRLNGSSHEA